MAFNYKKYKEAQFNSPIESSPNKAWSIITKSPRIVKALGKWSAGGGAFETLFPSDPDKSSLENFATGVYEWSGAKDVVDITKYLSKKENWPTKEEIKESEHKKAERSTRGDFVGQPKW